MYRRCKAERQPFKYHSAGLQKEIRKLHKMQEEYLFVINNDVKSFEDFLELRKSMDELTEEIIKKQKELYRNRGIEKRKCKTIDEWKNFVNGEKEYRHQLAEIANDKKYVKQQRRILDRCIYREINKSEIGRELLLNQMIPDEDLLEDLSNDEKVVVPIYDEKLEIVSELGTARNIDEGTQVDADTRDVEFPKDRESYMKLTDKEKAILFYQLGCNVETIADKAAEYLDGIGFSRYSGEVMHEVFIIQNKFEEISSVIFVKNEIQKVISRMEQMGMSADEFGDMDIRQKTSLFEFHNMNYSDGIRVYRGVLEELGYDTDLEQIYEEYDRLYDESNRKGADYEERRKVR